MTPEILIESEILDSILGTYVEWFPAEADFLGYRSHCLRMLNTALALSNEEPSRREKLEIALAFHDLTIFPARTLDYLSSATELALRHLRKIGRDEWSAEVALMIAHHHRLREYTGEHANLVEAFRKADWIDVTFGRCRYGLSSSWIKEVHAALPLYSFPKTILSVIVKYGLRHPWRPLPNFTKP